MFDVETAYTAWKRLENFEVHFRGPVGSIEGPSRVLDLMRVHLSVPRVPWYVFCCLEVHTIANMANFLGGPIWPPPGLIKDSQTSVWWGLKSYAKLEASVKDENEGLDSVEEKEDEVEDEKDEGEKGEDEGKDDDLEK